MPITLSLENMDEKSPPAGVPDGLPKEMWVQYLLEMRKVEVQKEIEMSKVEVQKEMSNTAAETERMKIQAEKEIAIQKMQMNQTHETKADIKPPVSVENMSNFIRVPRLQEEEDVEIYLRAFELLAETNNWEKRTGQNV